MPQWPQWPKSKEFSDRFFVPDLVPDSGPGNRGPLRAIFIGESPHRDEVSPEAPWERSPFRGVAGREWWEALSRYLAQPIVMRPVPRREVLEESCSELGIAVMNAVQYPIDPKIVMHQGAACDPRAQLGFEKGAGPFGYRAVLKAKGPDNAVAWAIQDLARRLEKLDARRIVCLGNDSRWFTEQAQQLLPESSPFRYAELQTIPHPSSWWRNADYRRRALEVLREIMSGPGAPRASRDSSRAHPKNLSS
jgi:hypothetical protein